MHATNGRLRGLVAVVTTALVATLLSVFPVVTSGSQAAIGGFEPGEIIDDSVFFDPSTMSASSIQAFLNSKVANCQAGYTCLKDYRQDTRTIAGTPMCDTYQGASNESAATIIYKVARACGINPQVLIVMLQKEQGLVTSTRPSSGAYRSAMGAGCPDTAPCDAEYYGFFDQVHYAAYLLVRYTQPAGTGAGTAYSARYDLRYPVGQWSDVQYHPNAGCGTKRVYIANQATHALYIYTPYTPNDAALNAGYGIGDSCSAYGNRNFYRYFTDWFGSVKGTDLVRSAASADVFLVTAGGKYRVPTMELVDLLAPLGPVRVVNDTYLTALATRGTASSLVRDTLTGDIYFVGGGKRYHLTSCDQIAQFGASCSSTTALTSGQIASFADGGTLGRFVQSAGSPQLYFVENGVKRHVYDWESYVGLSAVTGESSIATLGASVVAGLKDGPTVLNPGAVVTATGDNAIYLLDGTATKRRVDNWDVYVDLASRVPLRSVSAVVLSGYATGAPVDRTLVHCGGDYFVGAGGALYSAGTTGGYGVSSLALEPTTCNALPRAAGRTGAEAMAVQVAGSSKVWYVSQGQKREIATWGAYLSVASSTGNVIVSGMSAGALDRYVTGPVLLQSGSLVKTASDAKVYLVNGLNGLNWLRTYETAIELGVPGAIASVPSLSGYLTGADLVLPFVTCDGIDYVGEAGRRLATTARTDSGLSALPLDTRNCAQLPVSGGSTGPKLFVKSSGSSTVWYVSQGQRKQISSLSALVRIAGTDAPRIVTWNDRVVATLPLGPAV